MSVSSSFEHKVQGTVKSLLEVHALIEAHSPIWMPKMLILKQISEQIETLIKAHPQILKKIGPSLCRHISNLLLAANF